MARRQGEADAVARPSAVPGHTWGAAESRLVPTADVRPTAHAPLTPEQRRLFVDTRGEREPNRDG